MLLIQSQYSLRLNCAIVILCSVHVLVVTQEAVTRAYANVATY